MAATYPTKIVLAMKSGDICAIEKCRIPLTARGIQGKFILVGEAAHIYGENEGAARYKIDMTDDQRNHYDNLIYLCPGCHTIIDKLEFDYPVELLFKIKLKHEKWINQKRDVSMSEITFAELEVAAKAIASGIHCTNQDFHIITPDEKIKKNGFTSLIKAQITMGLSRSSEVSKYLSMQIQIDPNFPERLKNGFKEKYIQLKQEMTGDPLFVAMLDFTHSGTNDFKQQAAGLAIMCHLFEICEIFEK